jgi:hypothetical protein
VADQAGHPDRLGVTRLQCSNCGSPLDPRRVELGYDYCLKDECQERCVKRVELAALGVNKAADYYVRADEVLPPPAPAPVPSGDDDDDLGRAEPHHGSRPEKRAPSTLERLRQREAELNESLARSYERFRRSEITAREMEAEQRRLVADFNQMVMGENIRYRSLLRRRSGPKD